MLDTTQDVRVQLGLPNAVKKDYQILFLQLCRCGDFTRDPLHPRVFHLIHVWMASRGVICLGWHQGISYMVQKCFLQPTQFHIPLRDRYICSCY